MRKEYDFSKADRGKFYRRDARINLPVYLDEEVLSFVEQVAEKEGGDISSAVNLILRRNMELAKAEGQ